MKKAIVYIIIILIIPSIIANRIIRLSKNKTTITIDSKPSITKIIDFKSNPEIIGKIVIKNDDNTILNHYFAKTKDNEFYLTHDLNKKEDPMGAIFLDYRNNLTDRQLNIYGHNSHSNLGPFHVLENYLNEKFYKEYPHIYLIINNEILTYQIFSIAKTSSYEHMKIKFNNEPEWSKHLIKLKKLSIFQIDNSPSNYEQILILQTCIMDSNPKEYLLIISKKI